MRILQNVWSVIGPLVGVVLGAAIGWFLQRAQWVKNNEKQEYRELLTALLTAYNAAQLLHSDGAAHWAPAVIQGYTDAIYAAGVVLEDRIFIRDELDNLNVKGRWETAMGHLRSTHNHERFQDDFEKLKHDILNAARD
jgi:NhaP-type Na+/H+ or K+/H+ antiporter